MNGFLGSGLVLLRWLCLLLFKSFGWGLCRAAPLHLRAFALNPRSRFDFHPGFGRFRGVGRHQHRVVVQNESNGFNNDTCPLSKLNSAFFAFFAVNACLPLSRFPLLPRARFAREKIEQQPTKKTKRANGAGCGF